jgi:hypothetical protein
MEAGAEDANRRIVRDVTIIELYVDDEPLVVPAARSSRKVPAAKHVAVGMLLVCVLWLATAWALLDSARHGVEMGDIERSVGSDLSAQLLGDVRVASVRCVRRTQADARCVAELFDKSGVGPILQRVTVRIQQNTGDYFWHGEAAY